MKCRLCGNSESFTEVSNTDAKSSHPLQVSLCDDCGLVQQTPVPTVDELKVYYSHNYRKDYKNTHTPKPKHIYRAGKTALQRLDFLKAANVLHGDLLDIDAGGGEFVYLAKKSGFRSSGVEPNIGYSEYAKREYGCNVVTGELDGITGTYDVITIFHVLEHLPSPLQAFEKLHSLLNENGTLLVEVPWIETDDASPHNIYFRAHIFYFSIDTLIACASPFLEAVKIDTSSNLKIIFRKKMEPAAVQLPDTASVAALQTRLRQKGWIEYLFKGKGLLKPIKRLISASEELSARNKSPRQILDELITERRVQRTRKMQLSNEKA